MLEVPNFEDLSVDSMGNLKEKAVSLNKSVITPNVYFYVHEVRHEFSRRDGRWIENGPPFEISNKYIIFSDENADLFVTYPSLCRDYIDGLGLRYVDMPRKYKDHNIYGIDDLGQDMTDLAARAKKTADLIEMKKNFEEYKKLGCEPASFDGLDHKLLPLNLTNRVFASSFNCCAEIETDDSIIFVNSRYPASTIYRGEQAKYDVILEENIVVGLDEYGRLFATQFEDSSDLVQGMLRLKKSGYTEGVPRGRVNADKFYMIESKNIGTDVKGSNK